MAVRLTKVFVPPECGGGHITLKCEKETTVITLKHMALDKIRQKRLQEKLTGTVHLKVEDFGLTVAPPDWKLKTDKEDVFDGKIELKSDRFSRASIVASSPPPMASSEPLSDDTVVYQALNIKEEDKILDKGGELQRTMSSGSIATAPSGGTGTTTSTTTSGGDSGSLVLYLVLTNSPDRISPDNLIEVSGLQSLHGTFISSDGTGHVGVSTHTSIQTCWTIVMTEGILYIRDYRGMYLTSDPEGKVYTARQGGDWGTWTMDEAQYFISSHERYLTVEQDGKVFCHAAKTELAKFDACGPVIEGYLRKLATSGVRKARWQRRYFMLSEHKLVYWHMKPKPGSHEEPKGVFTTRGLEITPNEKNDRRFALLLKGKKMELMAESHQERSMWLTSLKKETNQVIEAALSPTMKESMKKKQGGGSDRKTVSGSSSSTASTTSSSTSSGSSSSPSSEPAASPTSGEGKWEGVHSFLVNSVKFTVDKKYSPVKPLGTGAYGTVCLAVDRSQNLKKVAIKKIPNAFEDLVDGKRIIREAKLLRHFKHPNIIALRDLINPPEGCPLDDVYMVMDFMETDLHKIIYSKNVLSDEHIQYFIYQTLKGLKYIHSANVIHRDLKPSNLLLNPNCDLKICDFGLARGLKSASEQDYELTEYVVTRWYRAPDVMCSTNPYDAKIDVWATGCILAELHGRQPIFPGEDTIKQMELIFNVLGTPTEDDMKDFVTNPRARDFILGLKKRPKTPFSQLFPGANTLALDLMDKMLQFNPTKRISVDDALKHPYFKSLHNPKKEIECKTKFNFDFEKQKITGQVLRDLMWEEIYCFRPQLAEKIRVMKEKDKAARALRDKTAALSVSLTAADSFALPAATDSPTGSDTGDDGEEVRSDDGLDGSTTGATASSSSSSSSYSSHKTSTSTMSHEHGAAARVAAQAGAEVGNLPPIPETPGAPETPTPYGKS